MQGEVLELKKREGNIGLQECRHSEGSSYLFKISGLEMQDKKGHQLVIKKGKKGNPSGLHGAD